jgi:thermostable 8-oxoguanine DNA glycosylase
MYNRDCNAIADHGARSPNGLVDINRFTLTTIQAGLSTCILQADDIAANGLASKFLWGKKAEGLAYTIENKEYLWGKLMAIKERGTGDVAAIADGVMLLMKVPNLGMVKASFVMQMLGFDVACIDSHNLTRLGMSPNAVKIGAKLKTESKYAKIKAYVEMCQEDGTEYWWDSWCEYVAGNRANRLLDTGDVVSKFHVDCVIRDILHRG